MRTSAVQVNKREKYHHQTQTIGNVSEMATTVTRFTSGQQTVHFICTTKPKPVSGQNLKPVWQIDYTLGILGVKCYIKWSTFVETTVTQKG